jgi:hypothetical protein
MAAISNHLSLHPVGARRDAGLPARFLVLAAGFVA